MTQVSTAIALSSLCLIFSSATFAFTSGVDAPPAPKPRMFSWEKLVSDQERSAQAAYQPVPTPYAEIADQIDYESYGKIQTPPDRMLYAKGSKVYPIGFYSIGKFFKKGVHIFTLERGRAAEVGYSPEYFSMPEDSPARKLPPDAGFAGFKVKEARSKRDAHDVDWITFLGASYFRAIGDLSQVGLSARGLAINTGLSEPEEFPDFTEFYISEPTREGQPLVIYAKLDSPSVAGAYKFTMYRETGVIIDVKSVLFMRKDVIRFGVAPLTSMFWFNDFNRELGVDWRQRVHDSDGLAIWNGKGEHIWRPLNNPPRVMMNAFVDKNPKGFGLMQRDRGPDVFPRARDDADYLDGVRYERRPSLWIEPLGEWGEGSVQLLEIPTSDETEDNIGAMWVPKEPVKAGQRLEFAYRMHWQADEPYADAGLARVVSSRIGRGGNPGVRPRPQNSTKFAIEFEGGTLEEIPPAKNLDVKAQIWVSRGEVSNVLAEHVPGSKRWRVQFDVAYGVPNGEPVDMRVTASYQGRLLTEAWLGQYHPPLKPGL